MKKLHSSILFIMNLFVLGILFTGCGGGGGGKNTATFTVGGTTSGLSGTVVLQNNGGDDLTISMDGSFTFATALADASNYAVTVLTQPAGQTCSVTNGAGTIAGADITAVAISCTNNATSNSNLPKTGQTASFASGDDGDLEKGLAWPAPRFTVSGDCVTDNLTGLMWVKSPGGGIGTWAEALTQASSVSLCGHDDWRLPNVNELESLVHAGQANVAGWLNGQGFSNVQREYYWSSTTAAHNKSYAWLIGMWDGNSYSEPKGHNYYTWPVRGASTSLWRTGLKDCYDAVGKAVLCDGTGQDGEIQAGVAWPDPRFTDNGTGTVTDNLTGLVWLKNADCYGKRTWAAALNDANTLANGSCGLSDGSTAGQWYLPNRKELRSLIDYSQFDPSLQSGHPFTNVQAVWNDSWYWSSTTNAEGTTDAWRILMWVTDVAPGFKGDSHYLWPVRAGE